MTSDLFFVRLWIVLFANNDQKIPPGIETGIKIPEMIDTPNVVLYARNMASLYFFQLKLFKNLIFLFS